MQKLSRYLLVGLLMMGMTVNPASAEHWFRGMGCPSACQLPVVEICPPVECCCPPVECCPPAECCPPVECCHEPAANVFESYDSGLPSSGFPMEELAAPPAAAIPEPEVDQPESSIVNRPTLEADDIETPAAKEAVSELVPETALETAPETESDSLFDTPATPAPMPEESPVDDAPADDLFNEPAAAEDSPAEVDPQDELLPSTEEETEAPTEPAPTEPAPVEPDETEDPSFDDLFGRQPALSEPGGLASRAARWWTDDGARFRCEARLQQVTAQTVILVKSNGKRIAVSFSRLSDDDLQFVRRQVVAQRGLLAQHVAAELLASLEIK